VDRISGLKHFYKTRFAGKELQSEKKMERAIQPEIPSPRCRADECMREHRETITGTRRNPQSAVQVAVSVGTTGCSSRTGLVDRELPRIHSSPRDQQAKAVTGRQNGRGGFFQRCLAKSRGSTPAERFVWREGVYGEIRDAVARQFEYRANVPIGPGQPSGGSTAIFRSGLLRNRT
jgi:hypothetical protein